MQLNRREFVIYSSAGLALAAFPSGSAGQPQSQGWCRAIAFDAFVIFDPRPIFNLAEHLFPNRGSELNALWKTRQFEYTWLRTLSGQYVDFFSVTRDALVFAAKSLKIDLKPDQREQLMQGYLQLKAWPDVAPVLRQLKGAGIQLGFLSNFSETMLTANLKSSGLEGFFDEILTTDRVKAFKPDRRAYQMGIDAFKFKRAEIAFAAFGGWDAAGAKTFGYPTFWVNRLDSSEEELDAHPDAIGGMSDLVEFAKG
jgi:2-haloacid dehalogenase